MNFINLTPHPIVLNDGTAFAPSGVVARVTDSFTPAAECGGVLAWSVGYGEVTGLPDPADDTTYIVSAMVLSAVRPSGRTDVVAPATGHPEARRNEKGHIISVPGFVR